MVGEVGALSNGVSGLLDFYGALSAKIACIWLSVWAIRRKSEVDYPLGTSAQWIRWIVVLLGFTVAYFAPFKSLRLASGFTALAFLCWPNLAYHLTNLFVAWPTTEGRVDSATQDGSRSVITYTFELGQDIFGGTATLRDMIPYSEGEPVTVAYDPLNPDQSKVLSRTSVKVRQLT